MSVSAPRIAAALLLGLVSAAAAAPVPNPAPPKPPSSAKQAADLALKLMRPVSIEKPYENAPLRDILDFLGDKFELNILIDQQAFEEKSGEKNIGEKLVRLPRMMDARADKVLRVLLAQVSGDYLLRGNRIDVTTTDRVISLTHTNESSTPRKPPGSDVISIYNPDIGYNPLPLVSAAFEQRPLASALSLLADLSESSVILKPGLRPDAVVTAEFGNLPLDIAVELLADQADLRVVRYNSALYVLDEAGAARIEASRDRQLSGLPATATAIPAVKATAKKKSGEREVAVKFENKPLKEALAELSKAGSIPIHLRGGLSSSPVTLDLGRVPVKDAVAVLADGAGLRVVEYPTFLYVTAR